MITQQIIGNGKDFMLNLFCDRSGKTISIANKYGMYCADMCDFENDREPRSTFRRKLETIMKDIEW